MTIIQFMVLAGGFLWTALGVLALYRRDVDYPAQIVVRIGPLRFVKPHRLQYKGGCALMYGVILIVCGLITMLLSLVIK
ncbi:MAG: hypothetical protein JXA10_16000 [Anaerolineae bacterium]|nr:hypothetical protein [Anaerolineae bacterium]